MERRLILGGVRLLALVLIACVIGMALIAWGKRTPPPPPTGVTAVVSTDKIVVSWTPASGYAAYIFYRSTDFGAFTSMGLFNSVTTFNDTGIVPGHFYTYKAVTYDPHGNSADSNTADASFFIDAPSAYFVLTGSTAGTLTWGAVTNATSYWVRVSANGGAPSTLTTSSTSMNFTGLTGSTVYTFIVQGHNSRGGGEYSGVVSAKGEPLIPVALPPSSTGKCEQCHDFDPGAGGFDLSTLPEGKKADPVDLATGAQHYDPAADLTVYNPNGPAVRFGRTWSSDMAKAGVYSPGLSVGWSHNYDMTIRKQTYNTWGALSLVYPNGATEVLTPTLSSGTPTGAFTVPTGSPYVVTGSASGTTGVWNSITVTWRDGTQWIFGTSWNSYYLLSKLQNSLGQALDFTWNSDRQLTTVADHSTSTTLMTLTYTGGLLSDATDCNSRSVYYDFETAAGASGSKALTKVSLIVATGTSNPPVKATYAYSSVISHAFLTGITVPSPTGTGNSVCTINYDATTGKNTSSVDGNGNKIVYTYSSGSTLVQYKNSSNTTILSYTQNFDSQNRDTGMTDANSNSTSIAYTDSTNPRKPTSVTDRMSRTTSFTYDSFGNMLTKVSPRSVTTTYTYDYTHVAYGRLSSVQEGSLTPVSFTYYEPSGLVHTVTHKSPTGSGTVTTTYAYDSMGNLTSVVAPGNNSASTVTTTLDYTTDGGYSQSEAVGQPILITDPLSHSVHLRYDAMGRPTTAIDANSNEIDTDYNLAGQVLNTVMPATGQQGGGQTTTTNVYQYVGGPLDHTSLYDENATEFRRTTYSYGQEREMLGVSGNAEPATYAYDGAYQLKTLTNAASVATTYDYDSLGRLTEVHLPGGDTLQYTSYDAEGALLTRYNGRGQEIDYSYTDAEGNLTDVDYPSNTALDVSYSYDGYGRLNGMTDATGSTTYAVNDLDMPTSVATTFTGLSAKTIGYSYYADGSRSQMTTPAGNFDYDYDQAGRPTDMTNPNSETTSWDYDNGNRLHHQGLANGVVSTYVYNALNELTSLDNKDSSTNLLSSYSSMQYDGAGNLLEVTASVPAHTAYSGTRYFQYQTDDRLQQEDFGMTTNTFGYDSAGNPTTMRGNSYTFNSRDEITNTGYSYDADGNPTTYNNVSMSYDPENHLVASGSSWTAGYNGDGYQVWRDTSGTTIYTLYDGIFPVIELDSSGNVLDTNTFGWTGLVSRDAAFYTFDWRGGVSQRLDGTGGVLTSAVHDAYGSTALSSSAVDPFTNFGGRLGYFEDGSGLLRLTFRHYDQSAGRFLNRDPLSYDGGLNLFAYVNGNPTVSFDPLGLEGPLWYDRWSAFVTEKVQVAKQYYMNHTNWVVAGTLNSAMDLVSSPAHMPARIGHLADGLGARWDKASDENNIAAWQDVGTICTLGLFGMGVFVPEDAIVPPSTGPTGFELFRDALRDYNSEGLSKVGRALTKHPRVAGYATYENLKAAVRSEMGVNSAAESALENILRHGSRSDLRNAGYGNFIEYRLPNGTGARWYSNGRFIGFIE